jgi:phosphoribosyl-ATP pyrophosphohydrolase
MAGERMKSAALDGLCPRDTDPIKDQDVVNRLWDALESHIRGDASVPRRTARLVAGGSMKMSKKLVEEAGEAALAAVTNDRAELIRESADVLYHLTVLWAAHGIRPEEIWAEMAEREAAYGLAEKRAKPPRVKVVP